MLLGVDRPPHRRRAALIAAPLVAGVLALAATPRPTLADQSNTRLAPVASTRQAALNAAVGRIPGYRRHGSARWLVSTKYGHWGVTNWYTNTVYISPAVPARYLDSVVRHEWSHILEARDYRLNIPAAVAALNRHFGGAGSTGIRGAEYAADCMAIQLGATWTYYTSCREPSWQRAARRLLGGMRLR
jgi:hypothetical protein